MYLFRGANLVPITKADANAKSAFVHRISVDKQTGQKSIESKLVFLDESVPLDPETEVLIKQWEQKAFDLFKQQDFNPERVVGHSSVALDGAFLHAYPEAD